MKLADTQTFKSEDNRRVSTYEPAQTHGGAVPPGLQDYPRSIYRVIRTVRTRKGFGTIIHTLTTFVPNKKKAHRMAALWVQRTSTPDLRGKWSKP